MAKYIVFFTFKGETIDAMMKRPSDRLAATQAMAKAVGGTIESYYLMTGPQDGFIIAEVPDTESAAAISLCVASTGLFTHLESHQLIAVGQLNAVLEKASKIREVYSAPGV
ncbi:MAG: GYD domain-containing protein [Vulcanimicrobiaceae bacterium]